MGLRDTFADAVTTILDSFDDLIFDIEYHDIETGAYNPVTNTLSVTDTTINTRGAFYNEKEVVKDWQKPVEDSFVCIVSGDELGIVPTEKDYVVVDSVRWEIARVDRLSGNVAHILKLRAP
jgi:hypothetical protein